MFKKFLIQKKNVRAEKKNLFFASVSILPFVQDVKISHQKILSRKKMRAEAGLSTLNEEKQSMIKKNKRQQSSYVYTTHIHWMVFNNLTIIISRARSMQMS